MKELCEMGIVARGFILVNHKFDIIDEKSDENEDSCKDLRGSFISAITSLVSKTFGNTNLEYLESEKFVFAFKVRKIKAKDISEEEPVITYGIIKKKKKSEKLVKNFLKIAEDLLERFVNEYNGADFTEVNQFKPFKENLINSVL